MKRALATAITSINKHRVRQRCRDHLALGVEPIMMMGGRAWQARRSTRGPRPRAGLEDNTISWQIVVSGGRQGEDKGPGVSGRRREHFFGVSFCVWLTGRCNGLPAQDLRAHAFDQIDDMKDTYEIRLILGQGFLMSLCSDSPCWSAQGTQRALVVLQAFLRTWRRQIWRVRGFVGKSRGFQGLGFLDSRRGPLNTPIPSTSTPRQTHSCIEEGFVLP